MQLIIVDFILIFCRVKIDVLKKVQTTLDLENVFLIIFLQSNENITSYVLVNKVIYLASVVYT